MNTEIYMWIDPLVIGHKRGSSKVYFKLVINEDLSYLDVKQIETRLEGKYLQRVMDWANIYQNWNYGVVSIKPTSKKEGINSALSPEELNKIESQKKEDLKIKKLVTSLKKVPLSKHCIEILDDGFIHIKVPSWKIDQTIDFKKIWASLEQNIIGQIKEGDKLIINDQFGQPIIELIGGSFLNIALADLSVYDKKKKRQDSYFKTTGLKGGLYVREDGRLDIGDFDRTFYLNIHTANLLKHSLKLGLDSNQLLKQQLKLKIE